MGKLQFLDILIVREISSNFLILILRYVFQIMPPHRSYRSNVNACNANATPSVLDQDVLNAEFRKAIQILAQSVTNKNNQQAAVPTNASGGSVAIMVRDFVRMNPTKFLGSIN